MGCRVGNRSSHRRSSRARNELPGLENTDRPVMRSTLCNILAASSGRRGGCGRPATNRFEGTGVVLGTEWTRRNLYHRVGSSKSLILNSISSVRFRSRFHIPIIPFLGTWEDSGRAGSEVGCGAAICAPEMAVLGRSFCAWPLQWTRLTAARGYTTKL
jgi:hypothetical protein